jgi:exosortase E/protease (VPEID-CTERM system)
LVIGFLGAYLGWFRESFRWPRAYLLLPIGGALIWLLNAARIAILILIGAWASPSVALGGFHSQAGWIAFLGVSLGLVAASRRSTFFAAETPEEAAPVAPGNPSASFLGPFLAILATSLITSAFSSGFDSLYGLRVLTGGFALWYFRRDFARLLEGWSWAGLAIGVVAFGLWVALEPASSGRSTTLASAVGSLPRGQSWAWIVLRVVGSVAVIPLAEELAFRGYLTRRLIAVDFESVPIGRFTWLPLVISSAAFGLLHGRWLAGMIVGFLYGLALYRRGKLADAVVAHAVTNGLIAATVLTTGDYAMWS